MKDEATRQLFREGTVLCTISTYRADMYSTTYYRYCFFQQVRPGLVSGHRPSSQILTITLVPSTFLLATLLLQCHVYRLSSPGFRWHPWTLIGTLASPRLQT
ncbi:hypothetical protein LY78DRAFT_107662 [Colletotrichum sublineola]|nr:hypothetical protein LY78DRAFT_107662 [Colletotrichum sublineola]